MPAMHRKPTETPGFLRNFSRWTSSTSVDMQVSVTFAWLEEEHWLAPERLLQGVCSTGHVCESLVSQGGVPDSSFGSLAAQPFRPVSLGVWWCPCSASLVAALVTHSISAALLCSFHRRLLSVVQFWCVFAVLPAWDQPEIAHGNHNICRK